MTIDPSTRVRYQLAFTLGVVRNLSCIEALAAIARRDASDSWVRASVLSSRAEGTGEMFRLITARTDPSQPRPAQGMPPRPIRSRRFSATLFRSSAQRTNPTKWRPSSIIPGSQQIPRGPSRSCVRWARDCAVPALRCQKETCKPSECDARPPCGSWRAAEKQLTCFVSYFSRPTGRAIVRRFRWSIFTVPDRGVLLEQGESRRSQTPGSGSHGKCREQILILVAPAQWAPGHP